MFAFGPNIHQFQQLVDISISLMPAFAHRGSVEERGARAGYISQEITIRFAQRLRGQYDENLSLSRARF